MTSGARRKSMKATRGPAVSMWRGHQEPSHQYGRVLEFGKSWIVWVYL